MGKNNKLFSPELVLLNLSVVIWITIIPLGKLSLFDVFLGLKELKGKKVWKYAYNYIKILCFLHSLLLFIYMITFTSKGILLGGAYISLLLLLY